MLLPSMEREYSIGRNRDPRVYQPVSDIVDITALSGDDNAKMSRLVKKYDTFLSEGKGPTKGLNPQIAYRLRDNWGRIDGDNELLDICDTLRDYFPQNLAKSIVTAINPLSRNGITTVGELRDNSISSLLTIPQVGVESALFLKVAFAPIDRNN